MGEVQRRSLLLCIGVLQIGSDAIYKTPNEVSHAPMG